MKAASAELKKEKISLCGTAETRNIATVCFSRPRLSSPKSDIWQGLDVLLGTAAKTTNLQDMLIDEVKDIFRKEEVAGKVILAGTKTNPRYPSHFLPTQRQFFHYKHILSVVSMSSSG